MQTTLSDTMEGSCLCGKVTVRTNINKDVEVCHCGICRRWGGGPLLAFHCGPHVQISGEENLTRFASSPWAERAFCSHCGTHIFYHFIQADLYTVPAGLFQAESGLELKEQIFIDKKPAWYQFANVTTELTEQQVFEKFAPPK